jgi:hypothetical protein
MDKEKITHSKTVRIPSATVKALNGAPYTLVAAPGAGKVIEFMKAIMTLEFNTTAYAVPNTDHALAIGGATFDNDTELQALLESSSRATVALRAPAGSTPLTENAALTLSLTGTGQAATGDSDLIVEVIYQTHDITGSND